MTNTCIPISDHCILFVNAPPMFMAYNTNGSNLGKMTPLESTAGLVLVNANITLLHGWTHVLFIAPEKGCSILQPCLFC